MVGRRALAAAMAVVVAVTGGAVPAAGSAREPSITVRPDTNLVDDQRVRVHGEGWRPSTFLIIAQCDARATSFGGCDRATLLLSDDDEWTVRFEVERAIHTRFGTVDCASEPGACVIGVLARPGRILVREPLHFDPEGPRPDPPLRIELDVADGVQLRPDGRLARVDVTVTCDPGQHAFVDVQLFQDRGEDDVVGYGGAEIRRCRGAMSLSVDVRVFEGDAFQPGEGFAVGGAYGFRDPDDDEGSFDDEFVEVTFVR